MDYSKNLKPVKKSLFPFLVRFMLGAAMVVMIHIELQCITLDLFLMLVLLGTEAQGTSHKALMELNRLLIDAIRVQDRQLDLLENRIKKYEATRNI